MSYNNDPPAAAALAASVKTPSEEVVDHIAVNRHAGLCPGQRIPYSCFARIVDVCCIAEILRNFPISSLRGDEVARFEELQSFFFGLAHRCLEEAGIE